VRAASIFSRPVCLAALSVVGVGGIASAWASGISEVKLVSTRGGQVLGQQKGYVLYVYCPGTGSNCKKGRSSSMWPPMIAYHAPVAGPGINATKLGTKKINGKKIITYYGQPLYRYKGDKKPGQSNGEARQQGNGAWYVVGRSGDPRPASSY
jgi:predicted lipoprotein with Yx(FWY)xxD motif